MAMRRKQVPARYRDTSGDARADRISHLRCEECNKTYASESGLRFHVNAVHTQEEWYRCPCTCSREQCQMTAFRPTTICAHIRRDHPHGGEEEKEAIRICGGRLRTIVESAATSTSRNGPQRGKLIVNVLSPSLTYNLSSIYLIFLAIQMQPHRSHQLLEASQHLIPLGPLCEPQR